MFVFKYILILVSIILYNEVPSHNTFIGAFLIITSGFIITQFRKKNLK